MPDFFTPPAIPINRDEGPFAPCLGVQKIVNEYRISGVYVSDFNDFKSL